MAARERSASASQFKHLNEAQQQAVLHEAGPLLVLAGAGAGKTGVIANRVAHLIQSGVQPGRILLLTFTRRAAREMTRRVGRIVGRQLGSQVRAGTFHSIGLNLVRRFARHLGLRREFSILDPADAADLLDLVRAALGHGEGVRLFPAKRLLLDLHSRQVNSQAPLQEVVCARAPDCLEHVAALREIFAAYAERKRQSSLVDFDDLLRHWRALQADAVIGAKIGRDIEHVLVDEYQDTNTLQNDILVALHRHCSNIFAVGDDMQAIYGFRAATVENIRSFPTTFAGAQIVALEQNYRSSQPILDVANAIAEAHDARFRKQLWSQRKDGALPRLVACDSEYAESEYVADRILEHREDGTPLNRQVVLFRAAHHAHVLELELGARQIPYQKWGGLKFVEAAHVKDLLALARVVVNPRDETAWLRVLKLIPGIGPSHATRIMTALGVRDGGDPLQRLQQHPPNVPKKATATFDDMRRALRDCAALDQADVVACLHRLRVFIEPVLTLVYDDAEDRLPDLDTLEQVAARYKSLVDFLADVSLDPLDASARPGRRTASGDDVLTLSTVHSFKGCEADVVFVLRAYDGALPSSRSFDDPDALAEECRVAYVAVTRARHDLTLTYPLRVYDRGGNSPGMLRPSRYVQDLPAEQLERTAYDSDDDDDQRLLTHSGEEQWD